MKFEDVIKEKTKGFLKKILCERTLRCLDLEKLKKKFFLENFSDFFF